MFHTDLLSTIYYLPTRGKIYNAKIPPERSNVSNESRLITAQQMQIDIKMPTSLSPISSRQRCPRRVWTISAPVVIIYLGIHYTSKEKATHTIGETWYIYYALKG